nr:MAG TPA: pentapeptide repeat protein [Caudoviricetes sp.]
MSKVKIEIKSWFSGDVLFEYESDNATMKKAVEAAVDDNANLRDADLSGADLRDADLRDANLRDADLSGANLSGADLSGAAIYYSDGNFDVNYRRGYFLSLTNLEEIETEMHHDVKSCRRWSFTWKNVLRIKSWKLKPAAGSFEAIAKNASAAAKAIADGVKSQSNDEKCAQSETPGVKVGDRVAFKYGDEPTEALCGDVIATKGSEAVVEVSQLLGRRAFILPFDKLIVIPPKSQEQSND